jgi:hypothetical protein
MNTYCLYNSSVSNQVTINCEYQQTHQNIYQKEHVEEFIAALEPNEGSITKQANSISNSIISQLDENIIVKKEKVINKKKSIF